MPRKKKDAIDTLSETSSINNKSSNELDKEVKTQTKVQTKFQAQTQEDSKPRHYACTDFHGYSDFVEKINEATKPDDVIYFLGDAGDRGPDPWETIKLVRQQKNWIYIKGNHEDMLVNAMREFLQNGHERGKCCRLLFANGGRDTLRGWMEDGADTEWIDYLDNLPLYEIFIGEFGERIFLGHSGQDSEITNQDEDFIKEDFLWDRKHFCNEIDINKHDIVVHGHTPIPNLVKDLKYQERIKIAFDPKYKKYKSQYEDWNETGPYMYCNNTKIDLDFNTYKTLSITLFCLDDFSSTFFKSKYYNPPKKRGPRSKNPIDPLLQTSGISNSRVDKAIESMLGSRTFRAPNGKEIIAISNRQRRRRKISDEEKLNPMNFIGEDDSKLSTTRIDLNNAKTRETIIEKEKERKRWT